MKRLITFVTLFVAFSATAFAAFPAFKQLTTLVGGATSPVTGQPYVFPQQTALRSHQAEMNISATAATVVFQGSNDGDDWITLGTINLNSASGVTTDGFVSQAPWILERAQVSAVSGSAGAAVSATIGD